jgi:hypothetical protein
LFDALTFDTFFALHNFTLQFFLVRTIIMVAMQDRRRALEGRSMWKMLRMGSWLPHG